MSLRPTLRPPRRAPDRARISRAAPHHRVVQGDLRGIVEDHYGRERRIRCSVGSFASIGPIVDGSRLVATIPALVATQILAARPHLRTAKFPFDHTDGAVDLLWPTALDADPACRFVREAIIAFADESNG